MSAPVEPTRYADGAPRLLAGIRRTVAFADAPRVIPQQWAEFNAQRALPGQLGDVSYGATAGSSASGFEYLAGVEVERFDDLGDDIGRLRLPAAHYAVFVHSGPIAGIKDTWAGVFRWLETSPYEDGGSPCFERYDKRYDAATGTGEVEIWVPIRR